MSPDRPTLSDTDASAPGPETAGGRIALSAGSRPLPEYELVRLLGRGGFGEVWHAKGPGGFDVALKFLAADQVGSERELRSLQTLQHVRDGHLLSLFGVWAVSGFFVLAMELADGTLLDRLNQCRQQGLPGVPREELLRYFEQAASGLDFLNEARHVLEPGGRPVAIQHGDVKPQNLMVIGSACKVGDFGLVRCLGESVSQKTGSMTAAYAPPEVFDRHPSPRSDQYSLAVAWCQLRSGRLPFEGSQVQMMAGHVLKPPDLAMLPEGERAAAARALRKTPDERWPSCRAFVEALRSAAAGAVPALLAGVEPMQTTRPSASSPTAPPAVRDNTLLSPEWDVPEPMQRGPKVWGFLGRPLFWLPLAIVLGCAWLTGLFSGTRKEGKEDARPAPGTQKRQPFTNSIGMQFAWIEPGSFLMGSPDGNRPVGVPAEEKRSDDETPHRVTLTRGFHLGAYLVTQEQWERVLGKDANRSHFKGKDEAEKKKLPVDNVTWFDCVEFCVKLSEQEGRKPCYRLANVRRAADGSIEAADVAVLADGTGYRLPSEAQWEYACRAGTRTPFWWGDTITTEQANYDGTVAYGKGGKQGENRKTTTPVDFFAANGWGLHDMHGNLWQWCEDWYAPYPEEDATEYINTEKGPKEARVVRGGSWRDFPDFCRAACRYGRALATRNSRLGCRVCLSRDDERKEGARPATGPQKGQPFTYSLGMRFVRIEPGSFLMGSPDGTTPAGVPAEEGRDENETPHRVTLTRGYHLGVHLVTQQQWETVLGKDANHSRFKGQDDAEKKKLPVDNVTWFDCVEFSIKLSEQEKRRPHYRLTNVSRNEDGSIKAADVEMLASGTGYRLPTEAEWEYACRAGTGTPFWWGATITTDQANYDSTSTYGKDGKKGEYRKKTTLVDFFPANQWGLHDMHGNLWEWCQDWYGDYSKEDIKDHQGDKSGGARVARGGSWRSLPRYCRAAGRDWNAPGSRFNNVGCRLLLRLD